MCIVFLYANPSSTNNGYKLIIAANRDEKFERPSKQADFLSCDSSVLCGIDLQDEIKGTWLGVTKTGKFGFLTNHLNSFVDTPGASRGSVVKNYLMSSYFPNEYISNVLTKMTLRPFNFIGGQFCKGGGQLDMSYYSNFDDTSPYALQNGTYVLACTNLGGKWNKIKHGTDIFNSILKSPDSNSSYFTECLIENLLSDKTCLYPDELIEKQCNLKYSQVFLKSYSSVMVTGLPNYGTRMQTVVLVDKNNHLFFTEKTLTFDKNLSQSWKTCAYDFPIKFENS